MSCTVSIHNEDCSGNPATAPAPAPTEAARTIPIVRHSFRCYHRHTAGQAPRLPTLPSLEVHKALYIHPITYPNPNPNATLTLTLMLHLLYSDANLNPDANNNPNYNANPGPNHDAGPDRG